MHSLRAVAQAEIASRSSSLARDSFASIAKVVSDETPRASLSLIGANLAFIASPFTQSMLGSCCAKHGTAAMKEKTSVAILMVPPLSYQRQGIESVNPRSCNTAVRIHHKVGTATPRRKLAGDLPSRHSEAARGGLLPTCIYV